MTSRIIYSKNYEIQIPEHPWKIGKYQAVHEKVLSQGLSKKEDILLVDAASEETCYWFTHGAISSGFETRIGLAMS